MDSNHTCFAVISLDSALKKYGNCYPQKYLKENDNLRDYYFSDESDEK